MKRSIIPNSLTMGNLFFGFIAILISSRSTGLTESNAIAGSLIFVASFFDLFDGVIARALKVESSIGMQLDSLADGVSYGIAPGMIAYQSYLYQLPEIGFGINSGMIISSVFPICATIRLARFNVSDENKSGFTGIPSPLAGIAVSSIPAVPFATVLFKYPVNIIVPLQLFVVIFLTIGLLMVSTISYTKLPAIIIKRGLLSTVLALLVIFSLLIIFGMLAVFVLSSLFILYGIIFHIPVLLKK